MLRDQFSALEEVYDKFAALLNGSLSSMLQRAIEVEFVSTEMVKYQECISAFSSPDELHHLHHGAPDRLGAARDRAGPGVLADRLHVRRQGQADQPRPRLHPARAAHDRQAGRRGAGAAAEGLADRPAGQHQHQEDRDQAGVRAPGLAARHDGGHRVFGEGQGVLRQPALLPLLPHAGADQGEALLQVPAREGHREHLEPTAAAAAAGDPGDPHRRARPHAADDRAAS